MEVSNEGETTGVDGVTTRLNPIPATRPYGLRHTRCHGEAPAGILPNDSGLNVIHPKPTVITKLLINSLKLPRLYTVK